MKKIDIVYNSFVPVTDIKIDGKVLAVCTKEQLLLEKNRHVPVFDWLDEFVDVLVKRYRTQVSVSFVGTQDDCDTFRSVLEVIAGKMPSGSVSVGDVKASLPDPLNALDAIYKKGESGPFPEIFTDEDTVNAYKRATSRLFEVSVIAAMSSGKSTLMNALLGRNLMPSAADACTATIVRITDEDSMAGQPFMAVRKNADGTPIDANPVEVVNEKLIEWNKDKNIPLIDIRGDVPTIAETPSAQYVFQDTPGPNNATNASHGEMTRHVIAKPLSMILYVMTPDTFQGTDNDGIFRKVCEAVKKSDENARNRFIFVLNKMDAVRIKEQPIDDVYGKACAYLESKGVHNPLVIPVCARAACLMRFHRYDETFFDGNEDDLEEYESSVRRFTRPPWNMYDLCKGALSASVRSSYEKRLEAAKGSPEELALLRTGIPLLEAILQEYLYRYALPTKVGDALKTFQRVFSKADKAEEVRKILSMKSGELKKFAEELDASRKSKDDLSRGESIVRRIGESRFVLSAASKNQLETLSKKYEEQLADIVKELGTGSEEEYSAKVKCEKAKTKLDVIIDDVKEQLEEVLKQEQDNTIGELVEQYNKALKDYLGRIDPSLRPFEDSMLQMDAADVMQTAQDTAKTSIKHVSYERHWYTLWIVKQEHVSYTQGFDMGGLARQIENELAKYCIAGVGSLKKQAEAVFENNKRLVMNRMKDLQSELASVTERILSASRSQDKCEAECKDLEEQIAWAESFKRELAGLLK